MKGIFFPLAELGYLKVAILAPPPTNHECVVYQLRRGSIHLLCECRRRAELLVICG